LLHLRYLSLICILLRASAMDMKSFKVKNRWICFGMAFGVALNVSCVQWHEQADKIAGLLLPLIFLVLYRYSMLGAADIKLLSMAGFYLGFRDSAYMIALTFVLAAAVSVYRIMTNRYLQQRFFYFLNFIKNFSTNDKPIYMNFFDKDRAACIHMTVPMTASAAALYMRILFTV